MWKNQVEKLAKKSIQSNSVNGAQQILHLNSEFFIHSNDFTSLCNVYKTVLRTLFHCACIFELLLILADWGKKKCAWKIVSIVCNQIWKRKSPRKQFFHFPKLEVLLLLHLVMMNVYFFPGFHICSARTVEQWFHKCHFL